MGIARDRLAAQRRCALSLLCAVAVSCVAGCGAEQGHKPDELGQLACLPHERLCGNACVDVLTNPQSCGACGVACLPGDVCEAGVCRDVCGELGFCNGQCVSLSSATDCGACGNACGVGQFCANGACSAACAHTVCAAATGAVCAVLSDDRALRPLQQRVRRR